MNDFRMVGSSVAKLKQKHSEKNETKNEKMEIEGETDICDLADFIKFNPSTFFGGAITH
jgi:hypothetical protein